MRLQHPTASDLSLAARGSSATASAARGGPPEVVIGPVAGLGADERDDVRLGEDVGRADLLALEDVPPERGLHRLAPVGRLGCRRLLFRPPLLIPLFLRPLLRPPLLPRPPPP